MVMERQDFFNGFTPEVVAISIVLSARRACKLDETASKNIYEQMFGRSLDFEILRCIEIISSLENLIIDSEIVDKTSGSISNRAYNSRPENKTEKVIKNTNKDLPCFKPT